MKIKLLKKKNIFHHSDRILRVFYHLSLRLLTTLPPSSLESDRGGT